VNRRMVWTIVGIVAIIGFVAFGAGAFKSNLTPYVSFQQAARPPTLCRCRQAGAGLGPFR